MTKTKIAKFVVSTLVGLGTSTISASIIANNTVPANAIQKASIPAAGVVIGMMAADATSNYTNAKIDEIVNWWETNVTNRSK